MPLNNPSELAAKINKGNYTGNSTANRAIAHGLGIKPKIVFIGVGTLNMYAIYFDDDDIYDLIANSQIQIASYMDVDNFYVGNATNYTQSANLTTKVYGWIAFA